MYTHFPWNFPDQIDRLLVIPRTVSFYGQILGDDSIIFTILAFLRKYNDISTKVLMELSIDKDLESQLVGAYTEQYVIRLARTDEFKYHDTIKARYFSPFCKAVGLQTDGREPALLKAAPLTRVLSYYEDPVNEGIYYQKGRACGFYHEHFPKSELTEKRGFPISLPQVCGGCSVPIPKDELYLDKHQDIVGRLTTILELPMHEFMQWYFRLSHLAHGSNKGLIRPLSKTVEYQVICDPALSTGLGLLTVDEVRIRLTQEGHPPKERGRFLDYRDLARKAEEHLKVFSFSTIIKTIERNSEFEAALSGNLDTTKRPVVSITFRNYETNWLRLAPEFYKIRVHPDPYYGPLNGLEKAFNQRLTSIYIDADHPLIHRILEQSPSLKVSC